MRNFDYCWSESVLGSTNVPQQYNSHVIPNRPQPFTSEFTVLARFLNPRFVIPAFVLFLELGPGRCYFRIRCHLKADRALERVYVWLSIQTGVRNRVAAIALQMLQHLSINDDPENLEH